MLQGIMPYINRKTFSGQIAARKSKPGLHTKTQGGFYYT